MDQDLPGRGRGGAIEDPAKLGEGRPRPPRAEGIGNCNADEDIGSDDGRADPDDDWLRV